MGNKKFGIFFGLAILLFGNVTYASKESTGPNGINSSGLGLTGIGVGIGQVENDRPGDPKDNSQLGPPYPDFDTIVARFNSTIDPERVFYTTVDPNTGVPSYSATANSANETNTGHATAIAGVLISTDTTLVGTDSAVGVAPQADLFSSGNKPASGQDSLDIIAIAAQLIATRNNGNIQAINISLGFELVGNEIPDGTSTFSAFVDWSARVHDVLYAVAGPYTPTVPGIRIPADNFNGITVAFSKKNGVKFRQVDSRNVVIASVPGSSRTFVDLLAPGDNILQAIQGGGTGINFGTSGATPHVTGTVALLQEHANTQISNGVTGWNANGNARRHEVMKAVLMNSADKIEDDGMFILNGNAIPQGKLLGMERTVLKQDGTSNWFDSAAYLDSDEFGDFLDEDTPLDEEMGAGHLNAKRALQQFIPGEQQISGTRFTDVQNYAAPVPVIGWDYGTIDGTNFPLNRYLLDGTLQQGDFISITLAWDREVEFANDVDMDGEFDVGDTFADGDLTDLDIYLAPKGTDFIGDDVMLISESDEFSVEHIFGQIPFTGEWEIWVYRNEQFAPAQDYGLAWWYGLAPEIVPPELLGDFDNDSDVDGTDFLVWQRDMGVGNLSDWENDFGLTGGTLAAANASVVPEPATGLLLLMGLGFVMQFRPKQYSLQTSR